VDKDAHEADKASPLDSTFRDLGEKLD